MRTEGFFLVFGLFVMALIGFLFYLEWCVWTECRIHDSFLFCLRVLGK